MEISNLKLSMVSVSISKIYTTFNNIFQQQIVQFICLELICSSLVTVEVSFMFCGTDQTRDKFKNRREGVVTFVI